jgi:hypothetical protein
MAFTDPRPARACCEFARKDNPIDLTGQISTVKDLFRTCLTVAANPHTEAVVCSTPTAAAAT